MNNLSIGGVIDNSLSFAFGFCFSFALFPYKFFPSLEIEKSLLLISYLFAVIFVLFIKSAVKALIKVVKASN